MGSRQEAKRDHSPLFYGKTSLRHDDLEPNAILNTPQLISEGHVQTTCTICGDVRVTSLRNCHIRPPNSHPRHGTKPSSLQNPATSADWQLSCPPSFDDETIHSRQLHAPFERVPPFQAVSKDDKMVCSPLVERLAPTKALRKGSKAHRRVATIPAILLAESGGCYLTEPGAHLPIENEFEIRLKIYERIDFGSMPPETTRLTLRAMRDSVRGCMYAITARMNADTKVEDQFCRAGGWMRGCSSRKTLLFRDEEV